MGTAVSPGCRTSVKNCCARVKAGKISRGSVSVCRIVEEMTRNVIADYPGLPLIFSGGVMSNSIISKKIAKEFGGFFAAPEFSADNAAGTAILAAVRDGVHFE